MEHQHTVWGWINHHWLLISLVYFPAFMGYLNSFVVFLKVMGWTKFADFLGRFENALKASVDDYKNQKQIGGLNAKDNSTNSTGAGPGSTGK